MCSGVRANWILRPKRCRARINARAVKTHAAKKENAFTAAATKHFLRGAKRYVVDGKPGFPDRIELRDLELGEHALLLNYVHQAADTP